MPALITHHLFGEESIDRLPAGIINTDEERCAFLLANQGPDPFFFRVRTLKMRDCMGLAQRMHRCRMSRQFTALRDGVSRLNKHDAALGRAFVLGLLSHYALDRNAHPFVYDQQWGIMEADPTLADQGSHVHAVIESDLDILMLQLKRDHATVLDYPPESEIVTTERINKVAGVLMSHMARTVYDLEIGANEYGGAVADMKLAYRAIEPAARPSRRCTPCLPAWRTPSRRSSRAAPATWTTSCGPIPSARRSRTSPSRISSIARSMTTPSPPPALSRASSWTMSPATSTTPAVPWAWTRSSTARNKLLDFWLNASVIGLRKRFGLILGPLRLC